MGDPSTDMLLPRVNEENFGFGFNDSNFSDRILHIEIIPEDPSPPKLKKHKGTHAAHSIDSDCCVGMEIENLHINSLILAAKSHFFYKLFTNGMMESRGRDATLRISSSEKTALMDLLYFMYNNSLSANTSSDLVNVLSVADKFEVSSCMSYCIELLLKMPMSLEYALSYLEFPSTVVLAQVVQPLTDASKKFLDVHYRDFSKSSQEKAMKFPISAVEAVLGSDGLRVDSEDDVFEFVLKWASTNYPDFEERRELITKLLTQFIRFENMSCLKLREARKCLDFDLVKISDLLMEALFYKVEGPYGQHLYASKGLPQRIYNRRLVRVVHLEYACPRCIVYFDLKKEDCAEDLFRSKEVSSESFLLAGRTFSLLARCLWQNQSSSHRFGLKVQMPKGSETCEVDVEFAVMNMSKFQTKMSFSRTLTDGGFGTRDLFDVSWADFISDKSGNFVNNVLHLRVMLTIRP